MFLLISCIIVNIIRTSLGPWVLGKQSEKDCGKVCSRVGEKCNETLGQQASSDPSMYQFDGVECKARNTWNYGLGFSQCTDWNCCNDGSCQYHCSLKANSWPGCKATEDNDRNGHHSRICPCTQTRVGQWMNTSGIVKTLDFEQLYLVSIKIFSSM